jgi:hypothetical protein
MTERNLGGNQLHPDPQAQAYLEQYWRDIGADKVLDQLSPYDMQIMHDTPLLVALDPLEPKPNPDNDAHIKDRNVFLWKNPDWLPKTKQEAKWANEFIYKKSLDRLEGKDDPDEAMGGRLREVEGIWQDAIDDAAAYRRVLIIGRDSNDPDIDLLRSSLPTIYAMGDRMFARECLDKGWPRKREFEDRKNHWRGFMLASAQYASDEALKEAFNTFYPESDKKVPFWRERVVTLKRQLGGRLVKDVTDYVPIAQDDSSPTDEKPTDDDYFDDRTPEAEIPKILQRVREMASKAHRIETMVEQGVPPHLAELRVLGSPGVYYKGELVGAEPKEEKPSARALAAGRPSKDRRNLGAAGKRIADRDVTAKLDRELYGQPPKE